MHIHEIVIDGFKSYANKTVVTGFDEHFNAITGLNGSGKSNILDSICFVLGISNLSAVRAGNLTELIYKQGQAGVRKASVTIIFNNRDEASSPIGYEKYPEVTVTRQVLMGGKSKYLINGKIQTLTQVTNFFHSVQLNVNNPHFLIMQGRITKVLNMKPHEILGMVEEAAGTRMYETKRKTALKTLEKKQIKVDELNSIISEEITPTLERLRGEKQNYLKWSKNNADLEHIGRLMLAYDYHKSMKLLESSEADVKIIEEAISTEEEKLNQFENLLNENEQDSRKISEQISGEFEQSLKEKKSNEEKLSKDLVQATSAWQNCKAGAKDALSDLESSKGLHAESKEAFSQKKKEIEQDANNIESAKNAANKAEEDLVKMQEEYQNMCAGISSEDGGTLPDQISKANVDANNAEARMKQAKMKINHLTKTIKTVKTSLKKEESSAKKLETEKQKKLSKVETYKKKIDSLEFSHDDFASLEEEKIQLENDVSKIRGQDETLTAQLAGRLSFRYSDPVRGFDRSKVKGLVAKLITVKIPKYSTALEVVAGGRLYQVVVDEAITGKALLSKGQLQRRVTIVPLDKISYKRITGAVLDHSKSIASKLGTNSSVAIEFVAFDEEVRNAIEYAFGSALVVDETNAANKICDATKTRTVTIEGDVYDPSGTISGGSSNNLGTTLKKLTELKTVSSSLKEKEARLVVVQSKWNSLKKISNEFENLKDEYEIASTELSAVEKHLSQTTYGMLLEKYNDMNKEVEDAKTEMKNMEEEKDKKWTLYNDLKAKEEELTREREEKFKKIETEVKKAKKLVETSSKKFQETNSVSQMLLLELENLNTDVVAAEEAIVIAEKALKEANEKEIAAEIFFNDQKTLYDEAKNELDEIESLQTRYSAELKKLSKERVKLVKSSESVKLEIKKYSVQISKLFLNKKNADGQVEKMEVKHPWIEKEKKTFGLAGGDYDFNAVNMHEMASKLKYLENDQADLDKKINRKVMGMIEKAEGEYTELLRKRKVVENDKKKISKVIEELDVKKKLELERTWVKVNHDFGSIFSTLLPGASSKLEPPEGMEAWEGLEVKVAFGNTWKESLSELSGGQRSLLALSLILSMLLYKPAPMYILDEVDAALDLSHTQNIGNIVKTHFSQSQFIVVSLKEGMFNNANVIYRTKFVDGVSTVTRTLGGGSVFKPTRNQSSNEDAESPVRKRSSRRNNRTTPGKENVIY